MSSIEAKQAELAAIEFLRQQYSLVKVEGAVLENEGRVWIVECLVSSFDKERKIKVKVNARTGHILGW